MKTRALLKILRLASLKENVMKNGFIFLTLGIINKWDICVQKI